ncbi:transporter, partial [Salmonella enterica]|nr:transporter [Salmonella enterica]
MCKPVFHAGRSEISVIKFDGIKVRVVNINGEPWFVGADVCAALEISNVTDAVSALDNDEVMTLTLTEGHSGK